MTEIVNITGITYVLTGISILADPTIQSILWLESVRELTTGMNKQLQSGEIENTASIPYILYNV